MRGSAFGIPKNHGDPWPFPPGNGPGVVLARPLTNQQKFYKEHSKRKWDEWKVLSWKSNVTSQDEGRKQRLCEEIRECHAKFLACQAQPPTVYVTDEDVTDDDASASNSLPMYLLVTKPTGMVVCSTTRAEQWDQLSGNGGSVYCKRRGQAGPARGEDDRKRRLVNRSRRQGRDVAWNFKLREELE